MKYAAMYVRVSTPDQNLDRQIEEIAQYIKDRGLGEFKLYQDKSTGSKTNRPGFQAMLADARAGKLNTVVCLKLDRMSRSLSDLLHTIQLLTEYKVGFISVKDQFDLTTASGRLMLQMIGSFAEFERELIVERVVSGLASAKRKGIKLGRPKLVVCDKKVKRLAQDGLSVRAISKKLGIGVGSVHRILKAA